MKTKKKIAFWLSFMMVMTSIVLFPQLEAVALAEETEVLEQSVTLSEELPLICAEGLPAEITEANIQKYGHIQRIETTELNKIKFKNRDDTVSVYHFSENIRYEDANGVIRDKSNQLFLQSDGSYKNQYNDIQYTFPSGINKGVTISSGNVSLVMTPDVQLQASKLPAVKYETDDASSFHKIVYENGFGTGKDIVYTPGYSGFKEDILLEAPPTDSTFSFTVTVKNGSLNNREQFIEILDESSAVIGTIGSITVVSANNRFSDGTYLMQQYPGSIGQKTYRVTMELDEEFLQSEDVVYPVTVDPSVTINSSSGSTKT
ncbi:MAG: hypothetical protein IJC98_02070, partial [Clostridia bacterium]|nr:hypothetical protein [Clostridia bacterium]